MKIKLHIDGREYEATLPDGWEGLTRKEWRALLLLRGSVKVKREIERSAPNALIYYEREVITGIELISYTQVLAALKVLTGWPAKQAMYMTPEACAMAAQEMPWCVLKHSHAKSYMPRVGMWLGPKQMLGNLTWERYALAEEALRGWGEAAQGADEKAMRKKERSLYAVLYAPMGYWKPWIGRVNMLLAHVVRRHTLTNCLMNYSGMREAVMEVYDRVFNGPKGGQQRADQMRRLTIALSGTKFGDMRHTRTENVHNVLAYLTMMEEERIERERAAAARKK
ncbi:hypothetical protein UFOVP350_5 [uncultured Caudovirales phage]|uniref:Uncharacterized protein n=1 Tax=uncultured Caudovirales phage TaxID=2100421 RepID=A0A6J5LWA8_9CAUD|nr:hypothetical protein UFOVP350_5 [uncultured Caudovirales phage]